MLFALYDDDDDNDNNNSTIVISLFDISPLYQPYLLKKASSEMDTKKEINFEVTVS